VTLFVCLGLAFGTAVAEAETFQCTQVSSLPWTITTQGLHCFKWDLATSQASGAAITIAANNVTLDLNGYKLGGLAAGPASTAIGIRAVDRQNVTIRNGTVRGFAFGIELASTGGPALSQGHVVEDVLADQNLIAGIRAQGRGVVVRRNRVVATGGSAQGGVPVGILVVGEGGRVLDNELVGNGEENSVGVDLFDASDALALRNRISGFAIGIDFGPGSGKYRSNTTVGVGTPYLGGTNAGDNH
jgi:hypothetical protein